jgi:hypothetical protein
MYVFLESILNYGKSLLKMCVGGSAVVSCFKFGGIFAVCLVFFCAACCDSCGIFTVLFLGCVGVWAHGMYYGVAIFLRGDDICGL